MVPTFTWGLLRWNCSLAIMFCLGLGCYGSSLKMELLAGIEPASESLSLAVSPITVAVLTFPPQHAHRQAYCFSSFMIRPTAQSFADVVSYIVEAWVPKCRCSGSDCCQIRQRMLNYLQRLILIVEFDASRATRFSSFMIPVETITSPYFLIAGCIHTGCSVKPRTVSL